MISSVLSVIIVWTHMMVINCPKYDNMRYCVSMFEDIPSYIEDYASNL